MQSWILSTRCRCTQISAATNCEWATAAGSTATDPHRLDACFCSSARRRQLLLQGWILSTRCRSTQISTATNCEWATAAGSTATDPHRLDACFRSSTCRRQLLLQSWILSTRCRSTQISAATNCEWATAAGSTAPSSSECRILAGNFPDSVCYFSERRSICRYFSRDLRKNGEQLLQLVRLVTTTFDKGFDLITREDHGFSPAALITCQLSYESRHNENACSADFGFSDSEFEIKEAQRNREE